jgi:cbb3-type cytochrome oxidase subunit 3
MMTFEMIIYMILFIAAGVFWFWFLERRDRKRAEAKNINKEKDVKEDNKNEKN